jgi:hypothetical protein
MVFTSLLKCDSEGMRRVDLPSRECLQICNEMTVTKLILYWLAENIKSLYVVSIIIYIFHWHVTKFLSKTAIIIIIGIIIIIVNTTTTVTTVEVNV